MNATRLTTSVLGSKLQSFLSKSVLATVWSGGESVSLSQMLVCGAVVWSGYSIAYMLLHGVILDEVVTPAQIIAGAVHYPAGHPHQQFYEQAYALLNYAAAALWSIVPDAYFISAIRNFLFLFLSMFVPFAVVMLLTGRPFWGYAAGALTASETLVRFQGEYPLWVYPGAYSTGHISLHVAVLVIVLLLGGCWAIGGFLLGLLVALHPAMAVITWPWSVCYLFLTRLRLRGRDRLRLAKAVAFGLAVCVVLATIIVARTAGTSVEMPYDAQANADLIYRQYTAMTDGHRWLFSIRSAAYLLNPIAFFVIGAMLALNNDRRGSISHRSYLQNVGWILLVGVIVWLCVYGAWLVHSATGSLPSYVLIAMPYRMSNVTAILLIPLTVAAIARAHAALPETVRPLGTAIVASLLGVEVLMFVVNRLTAFEYLIFLAWGVLFAMDYFAHRQEPVRRWASLIAVGFLGIITSFVMPSVREAAYLTLTFVFSVALLSVGDKFPQSMARLARPRWTSGLGVVVTVTCAVACIAGLRSNSVWDAWGSVYDAAGNRVGRWDETSPFVSDLNDWLARYAKPDEMILPAIEPRSDLQSRTGHPVLMEGETLQLMTYMPRLASPIGVMARDLYGVDYADQAQLLSISRDGHLPFDSPVWLAAWRQRTLGEWQLLGRRYGFRLVLSLTSTPLNLPVALPGPLWTLYVIPL